MCGITLILGNPYGAKFSIKNTSALIALGAGSTGIGYLIYFYLSHHAGLVFAALSSYLVPLVGFIMGALFLHESIHLAQIIGILIVFTGMWFIQRKG